MVSQWLKQNHITESSSQWESRKLCPRWKDKIEPQKNFPSMGKEIVNQVQAAQSFKQDKPKEEHTDTYSNQTDKN